MGSPMGKFSHHSAIGATSSLGEVWIFLEMMLQSHRWRSPLASRTERHRLWKEHCECRNHLAYIDHGMYIVHVYIYGICIWYTNIYIYICILELYMGHIPKHIIFNTSVPLLKTSTSMGHHEVNASCWVLGVGPSPSSRFTTCSVVRCQQGVSKKKHTHFFIANLAELHVVCYSTVAPMLPLWPRGCQPSHRP